jgi:hypothetical protein
MQEEWLDTAEGDTVKHLYLARCAECDRTEEFSASIGCAVEELPYCPECDEQMELAEDEWDSEGETDD